MPEVVVVTGASSGVGRAVVREFARRSPGVRIGLLARNEDGLEGARREVEVAGLPLFRQFQKDHSPNFVLRGFSEVRLL